MSIALPTLTSPAFISASIAVCMLSGVAPSASVAESGSAPLVSSSGSASVVTDTSINPASRLCLTAFLRDPLAVGGRVDPLFVDEPHSPLCFPFVVQLRRCCAIPALAVVWVGSYYLHGAIPSLHYAKPSASQLRRPGAPATSLSTAPFSTAFAPFWSADQLYVAPLFASTRIRTSER
ncbi:hypothetical protein PR002_g8932 [Phytophthora rubi]|uniref:RxLR effector protein n=1 Tax=Phytophthora rubi TaxID=129364 RepID=A0A6A3MUU2_9STRA|nr:hypothetical protein PR002_g8932 [Phytophthora rubi]